MTKIKALAATFRPENIVIRAFRVTDSSKPMNIRFTTKDYELNAVDYLTTDTAPADDLAGAVLTTALKWSYDENGKRVIDLSKLNGDDLIFFTAIGTEEEAHQFSDTEVSDMMSAVIKKLQQPEYTEVLAKNIDAAIIECENEKIPF